MLIKHHLKFYSSPNTESMYQSSVPIVSGIHNKLIIVTKPQGNGIGTK